MARKIWQGEGAEVWFGLPKGANHKPVPRRAKAQESAAAAEPAGESAAPRPLGIVEAHRKAQREKRVLKRET